MQFIRDEAKRKANLQKHGLDFADAAQVFEGAVLRFEDVRHHCDEQRMIAMGLLGMAVVVLVHVERGEVIRLISMRKADKHEATLFFKAIGAV